MYSLGIIAFELLSRFTTGMERIVVLNELRAQHIFPAAFLAQHPLSSPATRLITWLLEADPAKRPSAGEVSNDESLVCWRVMGPPGRMGVWMYMHIGGALMPSSSWNMSTPNRQ
jgi:hypothetical protein